MNERTYETETPDPDSLTARVEGGGTKAPLEGRSLPYLGAAVAPGILGAVAVAAMIFVFDAIAGHPLGTPHVLGSNLFLGDSVGLDAPIRFAVVVGYTLVHVFAFVAVAAAAVSTQTVLAEQGVDALKQTAITAVLMFVALEILFGALMWLLGGVEGLDFGFFRVAAGNAVASIVMAMLLYRRGRTLDELPLMES